MESRERKREERRNGVEPVSIHAVFWAYIRAGRGT